MVKKNFKDMFIRFDRMHERDGHTDRHRIDNIGCACIASRGKNWWWLAHLLVFYCHYLWSYSGDLIVSFVNLLMSLHLYALLESGHYLVKTLLAVVLLVTDWQCLTVIDHWLQVCWLFSCTYSRSSLVVYIYFIQLLFWLCNCKEIFSDQWWLLGLLPLMSYV